MNNGISKHSYTATTSPLLQLVAQSTQNAQPQRPPHSETILVTPELAANWLTHNTLNREVRKARVRTYAKDMTAGRWLFNTQGITFAADGTLIDGQHRLMAVVQSGCSVTMVVWFNVPPTTRDVIDLVGPRNLADIARLTKIQAAVSVAMMRGLGHRGGGADTATMAERSAFYRRFANEIDSVIAKFPTIRRGISQANVLAAIARASLYLSESDINQFCEVLQSGMPTGDSRDVTVIKLRDRLLQSGHPGGTTASKEIYAIAAAALRAFGEKRAITRFYPTTVEPFPLPDRSGE
jgi:hypothetical protein